ncbi:MAG: phospho-N-acetylmuramoyl-pentapeptide-transferase [Chloroflexi bacterium GWB2_49_20]|nr:MAG: phospho-N-acetylmuramoyl-pentapeptide-transferase [Chloroflexi bacterium GWB2_49_20]OGN76129.1 MAG: phospho-N-acetylmuramoyl-pentapeptide-transferase [Chloroflexi bacterium GWC2_49_37]OGN83515.1 MAG: phospho-N-acetylmuramoyl-pentapeptide-transferase [Chloroflexi bacterium GWD2_49_16]HBG73916.1 phospho-N-acetylmuramoyl-pentapeptide-transferase [Anaerolineae bacterium]HCC79504.1 phospho-N-acetylmuramoyl-pentapeptide-transferase [Anaerolineae bacterium]
MKPTSLALALAGLSFMMTVIWGGPLLRILRYFKIGKQIRIEEPGKHFTKMGTPTMGGVMVIVPVAMLTILLNAVSLIGLNIFGRSMLVPLFAMLAYGFLGAVDDWQGLYGKRKGEGMRARTKFIVQILLAVGLALVIRYGLDAPEIYIPGIPGDLNLGIWYVPIAAIIIAGMSNAVNFTDGLDGLAGLISATAFTAYGGLALMQGQIFLARFCFTMVGALFGFLWFNVHPAELFMGDTGSLSLGSTLAVVALMTGHWIILPLIAIIPVSELLSVIIQVAYFKITKGRRFFKMAPIHLHFELMGWSETQIVQRFWLIGLLSTMLGIGLALV